MTARNDITGDSIATKGTTDLYRDNYDRIFSKKKQLAADIGPEKTNAQEYAEEELALEEMRTGFWFEDANR
jgi:hypothetical protein